MKTALQATSLVIMIIVVLGITLFAVSPVRPVLFKPDAIQPLTGVYAPQLSLDQANLVDVGAEGPEAVAIDQQGHLYTGLANGDIVKVAHPDLAVTILANTGGRPLGLTFDTQQRLLIADAVTGLLRLESDGTITTLINSQQNSNFGFLDDVAVSEDGIIWVTQASQRFPFGEHIRDFFEASMTGRLLRYDPVSEEVSVAMDGLFFANGVTLSPNEDFLLINETGKARILRYWLRGEQLGQSEVFVDSLPALPDNIRADPQSGYWVALVSLRTPELSQLYNNPTLLRILGALPPKWVEPPQHYGLIARIDERGRVVETRHSANKLTLLTSVIRRDQQLIIGSLTGNELAIVDLNE